MLIIVLNTLALFIAEGEPEGSRDQAIWNAVDYGCVLFFLLEAGLKIARQRWGGYWSNGWNRFDFVVVVLSMPALLDPFMGGMSFFANVLVLRLGRIFRLFRVLKFIPNLDHLLVGIRRALRASVGVFLALFLVNFIFAMGATVMFKKTAPELFGNPVMSCYSMFKVFTVEGWYEIPDQLAASAEAAANKPLEVGVRLYFVASVLIGGIFGFSLANAVFVDEMMMDNTIKLECKVDQLSEQIRQLRAELQKQNQSSSKASSSSPEAVQ
jgi:voltage-gated sodium channel